MMLTLRRLERVLVRERAEIVIGDLLDALLARWYRALEEGRPTPPASDFPRSVVEAGFYVHSFPVVVNYLEDCARKRVLPDEALLLRLLLPPSTP